MALLIDGYNVLHMAGILQGDAAPGELQRARAALLRFIASCYPAAERGAITVVFDAHRPAPAAPAAETYRGIQVRYAVGYDDADELIEELIRRAAAPTQLVVVSSDRRLQRAAHRRRATAIASEDWYFDIARRVPAPPGPNAATNTDDDAPRAHRMSEAEVAYWLATFGGSAERDEDSPPQDPARAAGRQATASEIDDAAEKPRPGDDPALDNPFPPGYADDLLP